MAIDTASKRNSAMLEPGNSPWPPDGSVAADDRLTSLQFFSGFAVAATPGGWRSLFGFWVGGLCAVPSEPSVVDSLCICNLTFTPINDIDLSFTPMGLDVSFDPVNDLDIEFTPPCDC